MSRRLRRWRMCAQQQRDSGTRALALRDVTGHCVRAQMTIDTTTLQSYMPLRWRVRAMRSLTPPNERDATILGLWPLNQARNADAVQVHRNIAAVVRHERVTPTTDPSLTTRGPLLIYGDELSRTRTAVIVSTVGSDMAFYRGVLDPLHTQMNIVGMLFSQFSVRCVAARQCDLNMRA